MGVALSMLLPANTGKNKLPPFSYVVPSPDKRSLDPIQRASYYVHAEDLQDMREDQRAQRWRTGSVEAARSSPLKAFILAVMKTSKGVFDLILANPAVPFTDPIGFGYGCVFYSVIFCGLAIFQFVLVMFNLLGGQYFVDQLAGILTGKKHLSFVNWGAPEMFDSVACVKRGREMLGAPFDEEAKEQVTGFDPNTDPAKAKAIEQITHTRVKYFDLDVARTLLLFSAAVYERREIWVERAADYRPWAEKLLEKSEESILRFADSWGVKFTSISDLVSVGGTYAGAFYGSDATGHPFITVVFKGTGPTNYSEWLIDATCAQEEADDYLWGTCHQGFYTSLFPANGSSVPVVPYRRIMDTVSAIASYLLSLEGNQGKKVNLWVTGHSLGAALATLFYSRTLKCPPKKDADIVLRDCYVFGCPTVGGADFLSGFENLMHDPSNDKRTVWRVTNNKDVVARVPPGIAGPRQNRVNLKQASLLNYGPMGIEIRMRPGHSQSPFYSVTQQAQPGTEVAVIEDWGNDAYGDGKFFGPRRKWYHPLELMDWCASTFCPWLADHAPPSYWYSLAKISGEPARTTPVPVSNVTGNLRKVVKAGGSEKPS